MTRRPWALLLAGLAVTAAAASPARAVTFTVTSAAASGSGSLLEAVTLANGTPGPDEIHFAIPGAGVHTIAPIGIYGVTEAVTIDGYTQLGASPNTLAVGNDAVLLIEIDCSATPNVTGGVFNLAAPNITIRGLVMNRAPNFNSPIRIAPGASDNVVIGNLIGTDPTGLLDGNNGIHGVLITAGSNHRVGGTAPADRNVISANDGDGVSISNASATVQGNYIGVNAAGNAPLGNGMNGVRITSTSGTTIGGTTAGAGNVISANGIRGIFINGANGTVIQGNRIGTDATGMLDFGNSTDGIRLSAGSSNTTIGGASQPAGNLISGNGEEGIDSDQSSPATGTVIQRNFIGLNASGSGALGNTGWGINLDTNTANSTVGGTSPGDGNFVWFNGLGGIRLSGDSGTGNAIRGNSIAFNNGPGIELAPTGVNPNDPGDADLGNPNNLQNFPVVVTASSAGGSTTVQGTLHSTPNASFQIDLFSNSVCDPSGFGEAQSYLGATIANTDGAGNGTFNATFSVSVASRDRITATATDASGNTSELSACVSLAAQFHTLTPCRVADTRDPNGPYGGPALAANTDRTFIIGGQCGIPATAQAVAFNFVIVTPTDLGDLRVFPGGGIFPVISTMNWRPGQIRANNAVVPLGPSGEIVTRCVQAGGTAHFIIDVYGYFE